MIAQADAVEAWVPFASVAVMEKGPGTNGVPVPDGAVGVPVTEAVDALSVFSVSPAGSVPTTEKVSGPVPLLTVIVPLLKAVPTLPLVVAEQLRDKL